MPKMGRKRKANDALESANDTNKDLEVTNGTVIANNGNMVTTMPTGAAGQAPVTAAKTTAATVMATPGSALSSDPLKAKVTILNETCMKPYE